MHTASPGTGIVFPGQSEIHYILLVDFFQGRKMLHFVIPAKGQPVLWLFGGVQNAVFVNPAFLRLTREKSETEQEQGVAYAERKFWRGHGVGNLGSILKKIHG